MSPTFPSEPTTEVKNPAGRLDRGGMISSDLVKGNNVSETSLTQNCVTNIAIFLLARITGATRRNQLILTVEETIIVQYFKEAPSPRI